METQPNTHTDTRRTRMDKPTVQLRRPTCTELLEQPHLIAQLVLSAPQS